MTTPPPSPGRVRRRWRDFAFGALGIIAVIAAILLSDLAFDDGDPVFPEAGEEIPVPAINGEDPGGVIIPVDMPATGSLFEGAATVEPTEFDQNGDPIPPPAAPDLTNGAASGDPAGDVPPPDDDVPPPDDDVPPPDDDVPPPGGHEDFPEPIVPGNTIGRWKDGCADVVNPACPIGVGGTIDEMVPLQISVLPDATAASMQGLRCDPGYRTAEMIPFVILSTRPASVEITLLNDQGDLLGVMATWTASSEIAAWEQRQLTSPQALAPNLEYGVHMCVGLRLGTELSEVPAPDRNGEFVAYVTATSSAPPQSVTEEVPFTGRFDATRPPIWLVPINETLAYLSVPQKEGENTQVWVYETDWQDIAGGPQGCEASGIQTNAPVTAQSTEPVPMNPGFLDPNFEQLGYDYSTLWELRLHPGEEYTLCIHWPVEGASEEWRLLTPDGHRLSIFTGTLRIGDPFGGAELGSLEVPIAGVDGCRQGEFAWGFFPHTDTTEPEYFGAAGNEICRSYGPFGATIAVGLASTRAPPDVPVPGVTTIPTDLLFEHCSQPLDLSEPPSGERFRGRPGYWHSGGLCETSVLWKATCGCGVGDVLNIFFPYVLPYEAYWYESDCSKNCHVYYSLGLGFEVEERAANKRPNPRDWEKELIERATS